MEITLNDKGENVTDRYPYRNHGRLVICFLFVGMIPFPGFFTGDLFFSIISMVILTGVVLALLFLHFIYLSSLRERMVNKEDTLWRVKVEDKVIGYIRDTDYAKVRYDVYSSVKSIIKQFFETMHCALNGVVRGLKFTPVIGLIVLLITMETARSEEYQSLYDLLVLLQAVKIEDALLYALSAFYLICIYASLIEIAITINKDEKFLVRCLEKEISNRVCEQCGSEVIDGVILIDNTVPPTPDEHIELLERVLTETVYGAATNHQGEN